MYRCEVCDEVIPEGRVELGYTDRCKNHSNAVRHYGLMDYSHKTAGSVVIHRGGNKESIRRMQAVYRRKR